MKKAASKRLPHGGSSNLVLAWLWHLHMETGEPKPVSRTVLVAATGLPDTTVDDRLRVLSGDAGPVLNVGRGLYAPRHHKGSVQPKKHGRPAEAPGRRHPKVFWGEEVVLLEEWLTIKEYVQRHGKFSATERETNDADTKAKIFPDEPIEDIQPKRPVLELHPRGGWLSATVIDGEGYHYEVKPVFPYGRTRYPSSKT